MNTNDTFDLDDLQNHINQAFWEAEAADECADAIDRIGTLIAEELKTAYWAETEEVLIALLKDCRDLWEAASNDLDDARQRHEEGLRAHQALPRH
jgi:hypothetical protein